jgi:membrane-associated phospholipid phosphatase
VAPAFLVALTTFLTLSTAALTGQVLPGDTELRDLVLAHASEPVIATFRWINHAGSWQFLLPAALLLFLLPRTRQCWWIWPALMVTAPILEGLAKELIARPRPESAAMGFPSGHATAAAAYFGALIYASGDLAPAARRLVRAAAGMMIILVAVARVVLRAHWPSDVLGGIALGLACAIGAVIVATSLATPGAGRFHSRRRTASGRPPTLGTPDSSSAGAG